MNAVYHFKGVAHEITGMSNYNGTGWVTIRCGAQLSPYVGSKNVEDNAPVTCLFCISGVTKETNEAKDEGDGWSCGGGGGLGG